MRHAIRVRVTQVRRCKSGASSRCKSRGQSVQVKASQVMRVRRCKSGRLSRCKSSESGDASQAAQVTSQVMQVEAMQ